MNKKKKISIFILVVGLIAVAAGIISYAYWQLTKKQTNPNDMVSACLNFEMVGASDAIILPGAWPTSDENGQKHPGYTFTIENKCDEAVNYVISLESLVSSNTNYLSYENIRLLLDQEPVIDYESLETIESFALKDDTESIRDTKKITIDTVEGKSTNTHNIKIWLADYTPIEEQNSSFRSRIRITGGQEIGNESIALVSGDISRTIECSIGSSGSNSTSETCLPVNDNDVKYTLYDNGNLIISGTGSPKNFEFNLVDEIILNILESSDIFTDSEKRLYREDDDVKLAISLIFGLSLKELEKLGYEFSEYGDTFIEYSVSAMDRSFANSLLDKLISLGVIGNSKNITIEDGVNTISEYMFAYTSLSSINMADTVTTIEADAFSCALVASNIQLSNGLITLEDGAFYGIYAPYVDLVLPNSLTRLDSFHSVTLQSLKYPSNDTQFEIYLNDSKEIPNIEIIYLPENVKIAAYYQSVVQDITLAVYGPERNITNDGSIPPFKNIIWNYTD